MNKLKEAINNYDSAIDEYYSDGFYPSVGEQEILRNLESNIQKEARNALEDLEEAERIKKLMGTPIQVLVKCLEQAEDCKTGLKHINSVIADFYNGKIDSDACLCAINEILKDIDWSDKYEIK